jgi:hypothetical protein
MLHSNETIRLSPTDIKGTCEPLRRGDTLSSLGGVSTGQFSTRQSSDYASGMTGTRILVFGRRSAVVRYAHQFQ